MAMGHDAHAGLHALPGIHRYHRCAHDRLDLRADGRTPLQYHLACVVTFADHAHHLAVFDHRQCADVFLGHHAQGLEHHLIGPDGMHLLVLHGF
ncbi:hypothetical protein D3C86_1799470 [compost metagenome]